MRKAILGTIITFVLIVGGLSVERFYRVNRRVHKAAPSERKVLPADLKLKAVGSGNTVTFEKFKGKVILVNFWASWCQACMAEMPSIQKLYSTLKDEGFEVIGVNVDESPEKVVPMINKRLGLTFQSYTDVDGKISEAFNVVAIPYSIVAGRNQSVVWAESGERDWASEQVIAEIRALLKEKI